MSNVNFPILKRSKELPKTRGFWCLENREGEGWKVFFRCTVCARINSDELANVTTSERSILCVICIGCGEHIFPTYKGISKARVQ